MKIGHKDSILNETADILLGLLGSGLEKLTVERVEVGAFFCGVKLSNGAGGIAPTPAGSARKTNSCLFLQAIPEAARMKGRTALSFLEDLHSPLPLKKSLSIAVLGAMSETCRLQGLDDGRDQWDDGDILEQFSVKSGGYSLVSGANQALLDSLKNSGHAYGILDFDPESLRVDELTNYISPEKTADAFERTDCLLVTGRTLMSGRVESLLQKCRPTAKAILAGGTASLYAEAFFEHGFSGLGGYSVTRPAETLDVIAMGGAEQAFLGRYAIRTQIQRLSQTQPAALC